MQGSVAEGAATMAADAPHLSAAAAAAARAHSGGGWTVTTEGAWGGGGGAPRAPPSSSLAWGLQQPHANGRPAGQPPEGCGLCRDGGLGEHAHHVFSQQGSGQQQGWGHGEHAGDEDGTGLGPHESGEEGDPDGAEGECEREGDLGVSFRSDDTSSSQMQPSLSQPLPHASSTRLDRLLLMRMRRNRSSAQMEDLASSFTGSAGAGSARAAAAGGTAGTAEQAQQAAAGGPSSRDAQIFDSMDELPTERLLVVANRLPVTCSKNAAGGWQLQVSSGGLVSALKGASSYETLWVGWPGMWVKPGREREEVTRLLEGQGYIPVWIDPTLLDLYYNGFCNSVLWQLFHYVPLNIDSWQKMAEHKAMQMQWQAYQVANQKFADVVTSVHVPGDIVWVQDYHLMQLPMLLKTAVPKMKVGFFLHTPFPSSEIYRTLPVREDVLKAVLGADLIGFHTYDYARHFISSCTRILGLEGTPEGVENNGSVTRVATFPIGIDPERFTRALETEEVQSHVAKLLSRYAGRKIMLGVDRLDMVKGIPQKLLAYEKFLEEHPEWRDKVLLVQIAVPTRTDVPEYQKLRSMVHEIVGRINGQFGTLTYVPIYHLDTSLSFTELCALYAVTDVALVTSLRDGMNLVSYEYVACQSDNAGVLVLSEFAGAAQSLGAGAVLVNPWNITDMAQAIEDALTMSEEERRERHRQNYMHVQTHTSQNWADNFISELNDTHIEADLRMRHAPAPLSTEQVVEAYRRTQRRLIVLGYNATLTHSVDTPLNSKRQFDATKALAKVNPRVVHSIRELCRDPDNVVVVFSGSETAKLEEAFAHLPCWLAAENGAFVSAPGTVGFGEEEQAGSERTSAGEATGTGAGEGGAGGKEEQRQARAAGRGPWVALFDTINREWMEAVQLVLDYFCERTPRSFVEMRETSLVWNYKYADVEFGRIQARDLLQHLWTGPISNAPVEIIQGGKSVEVRPVGVTKGVALQRLVGHMAEVEGHVKATFDFVLCVGHLLTRDENMYAFLEGHNIEGNPHYQHHHKGHHQRHDSHVSDLSDKLSRGLLLSLHQQHLAHNQQWSAECADADAQAARAGAGGADGGARDWFAGPGRRLRGREQQRQQQRQQQQQQQQQAGDGDAAAAPPAAAGAGATAGVSTVAPLTPAPAPLLAPHVQLPPSCFPPRYLFTCTVGRNSSRARYSLNSPSEVGALLDALVWHCAPGRGGGDGGSGGSVGVGSGSGSGAQTAGRPSLEEQRGLQGRAAGAAATAFTEHSCAAGPVASSVALPPAAGPPAGTAGATGASRPAGLPGPRQPPPPPPPHPPLGSGALLPLPGRTSHESRDSLDTADSLSSSEAAFLSPAAGGRSNLYHSHNTHHAAHAQHNHHNHHNNHNNHSYHQPSHLAPHSEADPPSERASGTGAPGVRGQQQTRHAQPAMGAAPGSGSASASASASASSSAPASEGGPASRSSSWMQALRLSSTGPGAGAGTVAVAAASAGSEPPVAAARGTAPEDLVHGAASAGVTGAAQAAADSAPPLAPAPAPAAAGAAAPTSGGSLLSMFRGRANPFDRSH